MKIALEELTKIFVKYWTVSTIAVYMHNDSA